MPNNTFPPKTESDPVRWGNVHLAGDRGPIFTRHSPVAPPRVNRLRGGGVRYERGAYVDPVQQ